MSNHSEIAVSLYRALLHKEEGLPEVSADDPATQAALGQEVVRKVLSDYGYDTPVNVAIIAAEIPAIDPSGLQREKEVDQLTNLLKRELPSVK